MKTRRRLGRVALAVFAFLTMGTAITGTANAAPDSAAPLACPVSGQRVKTSDDPRVWLVTPEERFYHINGDAYFKLWDNYDGIITNDDLYRCSNERLPNVRNIGLVRPVFSDKVYIYDIKYDTYRWIPDAATFNKYGFSWNKIEPVWAIGTEGYDWR